MKTKIYFICPNNKTAAGGVKQIYKQVDFLNKNGFDAVVLHKKIGKRDTWFHSTAPVEYSPFIFKQIKFLLRNKTASFWDKIILWFLKKRSAVLCENSILVFPEIYGDQINKIEPTIPKVIFNQNCFYTFNCFGHNKNTDTPYTNKNTIASIVVSENSQEYLKYTFPKAQIFRIQLGIDQNIFHYNEKKQKQICFMPRKLGEDVKQVVHILEQKISSKGWKLVPIDNKTEKEVSAIMQESIFFLSFNHREGFGLPPAEAMACGCYVIGYHGQGGREYFNPNFSTTIEEGNILQFAQTVEKMIELYETNPETVAQKMKEASEFILSEYSTEKEEKETIAIWNKILDKYAEHSGV